MPDGRLACHRKLHAFEHPAMRAGSEHTVFDTPHGVRAAVLVCYDNNIVENVRIAALRGAELLIAPHQTGGCRTTNPHLMGVIERRLWDERESNPEAIERELRGEKGRAWLLRWLPSRAHDNGLLPAVQQRHRRRRRRGPDRQRDGPRSLRPRARRDLEGQGTRCVVADLDASLLERATGRLWIQARRPDLLEWRARDPHRSRARPARAQVRRVGRGGSCNECRIPLQGSRACDARPRVRQGQCGGALFRVATMRYEDRAATMASL